jgi:hypothetical protein
MSNPTSQRETRIEKRALSNRSAKAILAEIKTNAKPLARAASESSEVSSAVTGAFAIASLAAVC